MSASTIPLPQGEPTAACPICGSTDFERGPKNRLAPNGALPRCSRCRSLERHRIIRLMFQRLDPSTFRTWSAIQFSPDPSLDPDWFESFDLSVYGEANGIDIQAIDRPDGAYRLVFCSHVLEHVGDDRAALGELLRITAADGFLFLAFPDPFREEKTRDWGFPKPEKYGHWRVYGADVAERFARYVPDQPVIAYVGEDPVTGEREGCFLLPKSAAIESWIAEKLGGSATRFAGPQRA